VSGLPADIERKETPQSGIGGVRGVGKEVVEREAMALAVGNEQGDQAQQGVPCDPAGDDEGIAGRTSSGPRDHHRHVEGDHSRDRKDRASIQEASHRTTA
jgi:hypothetical protein